MTIDKMIYLSTIFCYGMAWLISFKNRNNNNDTKWAFVITSLLFPLYTVLSMVSAFEIDLAHPYSYFVWATFNFLTAMALIVSFIGMNRNENRR